MQIDQNFPDGVPRRLSIAGNPENVKVAKSMVLAVMDQVGRAPPHHFPSTHPPWTWWWVR